MKVKGGGNCGQCGRTSGEKGADYGKAKIFSKKKLLSQKFKLPVSQFE